MTRVYGLREEKLPGSLTLRASMASTNPRRRALRGNLWIHLFPLSALPREKLDSIERGETVGSIELEENLTDGDYSRDAAPI